MASRRLALIGLAAVAAIGLLGLVAASITSKTQVVQSLGVAPIYPIAPLHPQGGTVCEDPIPLANAVHNVRVHVGTQGQPGVPLDVTVSRTQGPDLPPGPQIAQGHVAGGWVDNGTPQTAKVSGVAAGQRVKICITNRGTRWAYAFGDIGVPPAGIEFRSGPRPTNTPAEGKVDGVGLQGDIALEFASDQPRSLLARVPDMFDRASAFRPGFVGAWTYWLLLAAILIAVPLLLWRALATALRAAPEKPGRQPHETNGHMPESAATVEPLRRPEDTAASSRGSRD